MHKPKVNAQIGDVVTVKSNRAIGTVIDVVRNSSNRTMYTVRFNCGSIRNFAPYLITLCRHHPTPSRGRRLKRLRDMSVRYTVTS